MNFFSNPFGKKNTHEEKNIRSNIDSLSTEQKTITEKRKGSQIISFSFPNRL